MHYAFNVLNSTGIASDLLDVLMSEAIKYCYKNTINIKWLVSGMSQSQMQTSLDDCALISTTDRKDMWHGSLLHSDVHV